MEPVREALAKLTETERKIVESYFREGGTAREIASRLGVSVRTVYKAFYKYRKALKELGMGGEAVYLKRRPEAGTSPQGGRATVAPLQTPVLDYSLLLPLVKQAVREVLAEMGSSEGDRRDAASEVVEHLKSIERLLRDISAKMGTLVTVVSTRPMYVERQAPVRVLATAALPSFLRDNPWIEVLRSRGT